MPAMNQVDELNANISRLGDQVSGYRDDIAAMGMRMAAIEQEMVAGGGIRTSTRGSSRGLGTALRAAIQDDSAFEHLAAWNQGTARLTLDGLSIQSALVNEPYDPSPSTNTGMPSQPERGGIVGPVIAQPRLLNFLRTRPVTADSVEFVQLSTTGDVGYQEGEGAEKSELIFDGTKQRANIATIAGHTTVSRQVLGDHAALSSVIDSVLRAKLLNKLSIEVISGNGVTDGVGDAFHIAGLTVQGTVMTLPTSVSFADRVGEAVVRQSNLGFQPGLIVINPLTWFTEIGTAKTETEKAYLFGSPASPIPPALWNLPVALEPGLAQEHALVLDLNYITVLDRERPSVLLSNSHADNFTRNLITVLGELRAGLEILDVGSVFIVEPTSI